MGEKLKSRKETIRPIIGSEEFGFTATDIRQTITALKSEIDSFTKESKGPDGVLRRFAENAVLKKMKSLEMLERLPYSAVLEIMRNVYHKAVELEKSGNLTRNEMLSQQIEAEFPNVIDYYPLLRRRPWGYRLGSLVMAMAKHNREK